MTLEETIRAMLRDELRNIVREECGPTLERILHASETLRSGGRPKSDPEALLTVRDVATYFGVTEATVRSWISRKPGGLNACRPAGGREYRIRRSDLDSFRSRNTGSLAGKQRETQGEVTTDSQVTRILDQVRSRSK